MRSYETESRIVGPQAGNQTTPGAEHGPHDQSGAYTEQKVATPEDALDLEGGGKLTPAEQPRQHGFRLPTPPSREQLLVGVAFWGVILLGAILRFWGLGDKPLHHDESLHAYFSLQLMHNLENWAACFNAVPGFTCYQYDPLLHGPFQFHIIALVYKVSQWLGVYDNGVNAFTLRIPAATLGTVIVGLPYFLRDYLGKLGAWIASFLLAVSPSMVYFSRFAREDIYFACFTLLLVVATARYVRSRKMRWIVIAAAAFALAYATKESTFLMIAIFGSFMGGLLIWELGVHWPLSNIVARGGFGGGWALAGARPRTAAPVALLVYALVGGVAAKIFFGWIKALSIYVTDPKHTVAADKFVAGLKAITLEIVPYVGIILGVYVMSVLIREKLGKLPSPERQGLAARIDPKKQPLLDTILTMPWMYWFFAVLCGWAIFLVLFTVVFTNIKGGIGDGIWQGLYYWLQQEQVARGGQPWYYYLLLIPLYEQIGVVFGLVGLVRCLVQPTRFRLFVAYWFVGNVAIYSWAAEKMPWLSIHITMPMLLLAAIGLEPVVLTLVNLVGTRFAPASVGPRFIAPARTNPDAVGADLSCPSPQRSLRSAFQSRPAGEVGWLGALAGTLSGGQVTRSAGIALVGAVLAVLLLLPTLQNMREVSYVHAADGPHEMMVYVQTTTDVNIVMQKIESLDQKLYGGKHLLPIGVTNDAVWPFVWYLRDYKNVCLYFTDSKTCPSMNPIPVIISGGDNLYTAESQYGGTTAKPGEYLYHEYHMRSWWDEGYKPPPCVPVKAGDCADQPTWGGVGPGLWLSYGDNPPPSAKFNLGLAAQHIWQWWWERRPFGNTDGSYDMALFIRSDLGVTP